MTEEKEVNGWDLIPTMLTIMKETCPEEYERAIREGQAHDALHTDYPMINDGR